jgi:hypothetical protein
MARYETFSGTRAGRAAHPTLVTISQRLWEKQSLCKLSLWTVCCPAVAGRLIPGIAPRKREFFFLHERSWDFIENKGSLWKTWGRSWNVCENKGVIRSSRECT